MARNFANSTTNYIDWGNNTNITRSTFPFTVWAWVNTAANNASQAIFHRGNSNGATGGWAFQITATSKLEVVKWGVVNQASATFTNFATNAWMFVAAVQQATLCHYVMILPNGTVETHDFTNSSAILNAGVNTYTGRAANNLGGFLEPFNGSIGPHGVSNVALSDIELQGIAFGVFPRSCTFRTMMWGNSPEADLSPSSTKFNGTVNSTTIVAGPPIGRYAPSRVRTTSIVSVGLSLVKVINETLHWSEGIIRNLGLVRIKNETLDWQEGIIKNLALVRVKNETLHWTEGVIKALSLVRVKNETVHWTEGVIKNLGLVRLKNESIHWSEASNYIRGLFRIINETINFSEGYIKNLGKVRIANESIHWSEAYVKNKGIVKIVSESLHWVEGVIKNLSLVRLKNETIQFSEGLIKTRSLVRLINETVRFSEGLIRNMSIIRIKNETLNLVEGVIKNLSIIRIKNEIIDWGEGLIHIRPLVVIVNETISWIENVIDIFAAAISRLKGIGTIQDLPSYQSTSWNKHIKPNTHKKLRF